MNSKKNYKQSALRQSNIELLRIIAMILIIAHHYSFHGGFSFPPEPINLNRLWIQFILIGGKVGVDLFVLISGYFLVSQSSIKADKILKLWFQIFFYSITIFIIFTILGLRSFSIKDFVKHLAPVTFEQWWFASTYFVLYLLVPYINKLLRSFSQKQYVHFLAVILVLWSVIPTFTRHTFQSNSLLWFIVLYAIAGYYKLFGIKTNLTSRKLIWLSVASTAFTFGLVVLFDILGTKIRFFYNHATFFYEMYMLPILVISVLMFLGFINLKVNYSKLINLISSATFGVYLIHDDNYVRPFLWKTLFKNASYSNSCLLIPSSLIVIAIVFIGCSMIDLLRIWLFEDKIVIIINKLSSIIDYKIIPFVSNKISDCWSADQ